MNVSQKHPSWAGCLQLLVAGWYYAGILHRSILRFQFNTNACNFWTTSWMGCPHVLSSRCAGFVPLSTPESLESFGLDCLSTRPLPSWGSCACLRFEKKTYTTSFDITKDMSILSIYRKQLIQKHFQSWSIHWSGLKPFPAVLRCKHRPPEVLLSYTLLQSSGRFFFKPAPLNPVLNLRNVVTGTFVPRLEWSRNDFVILLGWLS